MAVPFSNTKLRVPRGFQNLLEGFAREVLRSQPEELYAFGAEYFENLIKQREESGIDPTEHGAKMEDRFYNNKAFSQPEIDPSDPAQQDAALAIQTKFRQHAAKQEVEVIREEKAATKIQAGFRGHEDRTQVPDGETDREKAPESTAPADEEVDIDLNDPDIEAAAIKIQASFKGFQTRKTMRTGPGLLSPEQPPNNPQETIIPSANGQDEEIDIDLEDPDVEQAAVKIQAGFKGMKARQQVRSMKGTDDTSSSPVLVEQQPVIEEIPVAVMMRSPSPAMLKTEPLKMVTLDKSCAPEPYDEEIDIDLEDPQVEQAALKIQAGFKGMQARREVREIRQGLDDKATIVSHSQTAPEVDIDLNDPEVELAALKIQAGFKGMKTRQELKANLGIDKGSGKSVASEHKTPEATEVKPDETAAPAEEGESSAPKPEATEPADEANTATKPAEEEIDIDLDDPEVQAAAVKIQAGFKGLKTRREMSAKRSAAQSETGSTTAAETESKPTDTEVAVTEQPPADAEQTATNTEVAAASDETPAAEAGAESEQVAPAAEGSQETEQAAPAADGAEEASADKAPTDDDAKTEEQPAEPPKDTENSETAADVEPEAAAESEPAGTEKPAAEAEQVPEPAPADAVDSAPAAETATTEGAAAPAETEPVAAEPPATADDGAAE